MLVGYAWVSTREQNLDLQRDALIAAGCERIFEDQASGGRIDREGLARALSHLRTGDTLVVWEARPSGAHGAPARRVYGGSAFSST